MTAPMLFGPDDQPINGSVPDLNAIAQAAIAERQKPYELLTLSAIHAMPDPSYLLKPVLVSEGTNLLYGASGTFKSFVAWDWALCIAAGLEWYGHEVARAPVVYLAGEGVGGLKLRLEAWEQTHPGADPNSHFRLLPNAVNLLDDDEKARVANTLNGLAEEMGEPCGLLVVDTLARSMVGGDENSAQDVGRFIANIDEIARPQAVLIVHHTGKDGATERGSSALRGAADSMIKTERPASDKTRTKVVLSCTKSKDAAEFDDIPLVAVPTARSITLQYDLTPAKTEVDLKDQVLGYIARQDEPVGKDRVKSAMGRRQSDVFDAIDTLLFEERIEKVKDGRRVLLQLCPARSGQGGTELDSRDPGNPSGTLSPGGGPRRGHPPDRVPEPTSMWTDGTLSQHDVNDNSDVSLVDVDAGIEGVAW